MIHIEATLAESRQVELDLLKQLAKTSTKIHKLGGGLPRAQSLKEPIYVPSTNQQVTLTFFTSNPFYHMHQALHKEPVPGEPAQKCFQDVIQEVHQMKQICQKLLTPQKEQPQEEYHKTLIMDLQKLQTNRIDLDKAQTQMHESQISIKEKMRQSSKLCLHGNCDQINRVLEKALQRLEELEQRNSQLEKVLVNQNMNKQMAEKQNSHLRQEIARIDEEKCDEIKKLRQEIQKLKIDKENSLQHAPIYEIGRVPIDNVSQKSIKKIQPKQRRALTEIEVESNLKDSILISESNQPQDMSQSMSKKLKRAVYL